MKRIGRKAVLALCLCLPFAATGAEPTRASEPSAAGQRESDLLLERAFAPWTGDLDSMLKRGFIRIAVPHNPLYFIFDGAKRIGLAAERGALLETYLEKTTGQRIMAMFLPRARDQLLAALVKGEADLVDAGLTITDERKQSVEFTEPLRTDVIEVVVTSGDAGAIDSFDELSRLDLHLRPSSSYFGHVTALNEERKRNGERPIRVVAVDEILEDVDLLEMLQADIISATVVDLHKAELWVQVFGNIRVHENLVVHSGGETGIAFRTGSPKLETALNKFVGTVKEQTKLGNILDRRYLESTKWITKLSSKRGQAQADRAIELAQVYGERYHFDWVLIAALAYQESGFDQDKRSSTGAVGIMQILPSTASDPNVNIPNVTDEDANVHAGVKYLNFLREEYYASTGMDDFDQALFSIAAYNAGPGNIEKARRRAEATGLNPNVWFNNTELATAEAVGEGPVTYVRNIFKYAVDLRLSDDIASRREHVTGEASK